MKDPVLGTHTAVISVDADASLNRPKLKITFTIEDGPKGFKIVSRGHISLEDRILDAKSKPYVLKEYAMENKNSFIYYNPAKQVASLLILNDGNTDPTGLDEFMETIKLQKDSELKAAIDFASFYWVALQSGTATCDVIAQQAEELLDKIEDDQN